MRVLWVAACLHAYLPFYSHAQGTAYDSIFQLEEPCTSEQIIKTGIKNDFWSLRPRVHGGIIAYIKHNPVIPTDEVFVYDLNRGREVKLSNYGFTVYYHAVAVSQNVVVVSVSGITGTGSQLEAFYTGGDGLFGTNDDMSAIIATDPRNLYDTVDVFSFGDGVIDVAARKLAFFFNAGYTQLNYDFAAVSKTEVNHPSPNLFFLTGEIPVGLIWGSQSAVLEFNTTHSYGSWLQSYSQGETLFPQGNMKLGNSGALGHTVLKGNAMFFALLEERTPLFQTKNPKGYLSIAIVDPLIHYTYPITPVYDPNKVQIGSASIGEVTSLNKTFVAYERTIWGGISDIRLIDIPGVLNVYPEVTVAKNASDPDVHEHDLIYMRRDVLHHRRCF